MNKAEIIRTSSQPKLRVKLSHEFLSISDHHYHVPIASPVSSPMMRARKNIISSMLKTSFHSKSLEDHTAHTESSSGSQSDKFSSSPRKSRKHLSSSMHSLPTKGKAGILKLLSERSMSPLKIARSKGYSSYVANESMSSIVTALNDVSVSLGSPVHEKGETKRPTCPHQTFDEEDSVSANEEKSSHNEGDSACSTFKPYGHYMINQADTNTLWVSSDTSPRPHLELNIVRDDSPPDLMVGRSSSNKRRRPVRSRSLRFALKDAEKKGITSSSPSKSPRRNRRNSME